MSFEFSSQPTQSPNFLLLNEGQPHQVARRELNSKGLAMAQAEGWDPVERFPVPDGQVAWDVECPGYNPQFVDMPRGNTRFRKEGDRPDPANPRHLDRNLTSLEPTIPSYHVADYLRDPAGQITGPVPVERSDEYGPYHADTPPAWARTPYEGHYNVEVDEGGYPLNPLGRTGLRGRFMLDKWGPTPAADPILTRTNPENGALEALLVKRGDTGEWALPGGKVDDGEEPWQAAARELVEEAGVRGVELDFSTARRVYAGYGDDSRNTDNAWMETTALHLHLDDNQSRTVTIEAGSDADAAQWVPVDEDLYLTLFSSHGQYLRLAVGGPAS